MNLRLPPAAQVTTRRNVPRNPTRRERRGDGGRFECSMISAATLTQESQMWTWGPAIIWETSFSLLLQKEHRRSLGVSGILSLLQLRQAAPRESDWISRSG
jgi:hypothetical protein